MQKKVILLCILCICVGLFGGYLITNSKSNPTIQEEKLAVEIIKQAEKTYEQHQEKKAEEEKVSFLLNQFREDARKLFQDDPNILKLHEEWINSGIARQYILSDRDKKYSFTRFAEEKTK